MNNKKVIALRTVLIIMTVAVMVIIFTLSADNADESNAKSDLLSDSIIYKILSVFDLTEEELQPLVDNCVIVVRKTAHFAEYAVLGFLLYAVFASFFLPVLRSAILSFFTGTLYAVSDEIHQYFVPGRSCQLSDMLLDSAGAFCGILALIFISRCIKKQKKYNNYSV